MSIPPTVDELHSLGILHIQEDRLDEAEHCFRQAVQIAPDNSVLQLHLANVFKLKKLFPEAEQTLLALAKADPNFAAVYNNLGTLYFAQAKWQQAVDAYQVAIQKQANYADAYYNLGLAFNKLKKYDEAMHAYQALLALSPDHVGAQFQLGCLFLERHQPEKALTYFSKLHQAHPFHFETIMNMAIASLQLNLIAEAKAYYLKALEIKPQDIQALFNLGVLASQLGQLSEAIDFYLRVIAIDPDHYAAQYNVGVAYAILKNQTAALAHLQAALRLQPQNESVSYLVKALSQSKDITASPPAYISSLFDSYAHHYEQHMNQSLRYQIPTLFAEVIKVISEKDQRHWRVLDLGCGTGLCAPAIKAKAAHLLGVDLSAEMLAIANEKKLYDELICTDMLAYLQTTNQQFDMVLAGDAFIYTGDLDQVFANVARILNPDGWFLFNVEAGESDDYALMPSGRFVHSKAYIDRLLSLYQFHLIEYRPVTLRQQERAPVRGYLYLLQR